MHIPLTPEEFKRLLKLAYLGEAVLNDWTPPERMSDEQAASTDVLYDLCTQASESPSAELVTFDQRMNEWIPSPELDRQLDPVLADYDNAVFWDELVLRLARRDLMAEYGADALERMGAAYRSQAELPFIDYYRTEVRDHGIDRLIVRDESAKPADRRRGTQRKRPRSGTAKEEAEARE